MTSSPLAKSDSKGAQRAWRQYAFSFLLSAACLDYISHIRDMMDDNLQTEVPRSQRFIKRMKQEASVQTVTGGLRVARSFMGVSNTMICHAGHWPGSIAQVAHALWGCCLIDLIESLLNICSTSCNAPDLEGKSKGSAQPNT